MTVKPWINDDIFKTWTEAQKRLWDSLCSAVPFQPPAGVEAWRETYLKNLATWEAAVRQTLAQEATWVRQWVQRVAHEKDTPELMAAWVRQMEEVLQRWVQTQNQWWDEYFSVLRYGGLVYPERARTESVAVPVTAAEPVLATAPKLVVEVVEPTPITPITPEAANEVSTEPAAEPAANEANAEPAAAVVETPVEPQPKPTAAPTSDQPDDLKLIVGIGPALEKKLNAHGILSFRQLALLSDQDIDRIDAAIKATGRIRRDDWIGQARKQHLEKYGEHI